MSTLRLHLDEDADAHALLSALCQRGVAVTSSREMGLLEYSDEDQLRWALDEERALYTYNARDFCRLHSALLRAGRHHAGIIIGEQQLLSVGEEMRRLLRLCDARSPEDMRDRLEYLGNWSSDAAPSSAWP